MADPETGVTPVRRSPSGLPMRAIIPNAITMMALCCGASGLKFAIGGEFDKAVAAVVIAGVLDGIDGRIARMLRGTSRFGAELDSLSDVIAFGVAPGLILYLWALEGLGRLGWPIALLLPVCCALRLARFNAAIDQDEKPKKRLGFTTGVPAPAGAGLALSPLLYNLATNGSLDAQPETRALIVAITTVLTAFLMVSALAVWGYKAVRIPTAWRIFLLVGVGLFVASLVQAPWVTLFSVTVAYAVALPFAVLRYAQLRKAEIAAGIDVIQ